MTSKIRKVIRSLSETLLGKSTTTSQPQKNLQAQSSEPGTSVFKKISSTESSSDEETNSDEETSSDEHELSWDEDAIKLEKTTPLRANIPDDSLTEDITKGFFEFAIKMNQLLYREISPEEKNVVFSPISVYSALSVLHLGADGKSRDELSDLLGLPNTGDEIEQAHERLIQVLQIIQETENITIHMANGIFAQKDVDFIQSFKSHVQTYQRGKISNVDFQNEPIKTTDYINQFISKSTDDRITHLFTYPLSPDSRLVIATSLYFKATWNIRFRDNNTKKKHFHTSSGKIPAIFMNRRGYEYYANFADLKLEVLRIPYELRHVSMYYLLPYTNHTLDDLVASLDITNIQRIIDQTQSDTYVDVKIPRMKYKWSNDIKNYLSKLGIEEIFTSNANLTNMANTELAISKITHSTEIEFNENGTDANTVTAVCVKRLLPLRQKPILFHVNRPFLFFIYHRLNGMILFMGAIHDPNVAE